MAFRDPVWTASRSGWRRRIGHWVLRVGAETSGRRGWMVLQDGEIQGLGHVATFAEGIDRAEREQCMLTGDAPRQTGITPAAVHASRPVASVDSAV